MPIAKTYAAQLIEYTSEPFKKDGRTYVMALFKCSRCGGSGNYAYNPKDGSRCFRCGGSGKESAQVRWYTEPEMEAQERAAERKREKIEEDKIATAPLIRREFLKKNGFSEEGFTWIFLGDTFLNKDLIKIAGGVYNSVIGWHIGHEPKVELFDGTVLPYFKASVDEVLTFSEYGFGSFKEEAKDLIQQKTNELNPSTKVSDYVGLIGERLKLVPCSVQKIKGVPSAYGNAKLVVFEDERGNKMVWFTTAAVDAEEKDSILLTGTVKEHSVYRGEKQTTLTRCIIKKAEKEILRDWT